MTQEELIDTVKKLPLNKRAQVLEAISDSIKEELQAEDSTKHNLDEFSREEKLAAFRRLRGMWKTDGPSPSGEELKDDYISYLEEKYS